LDWLKRGLVTDKQILIFVHHPVLKTNMPLGAALEDREKFAEMLRSSRNEVIVFCGHYHMDDEPIDGNVRHYSTPAASYLIEKS
jgi:hypothetical protein